MNVGILIQARLKSKRLPYKLLRPLGGKTMIGYLIDRLKPLGFPVILCTSMNKQDESLSSIASNHKISCFRGSEDDLASRFLSASFNGIFRHADRDETLFKYSTIIRVTADNPLTDINLMLDLLGHHLRSPTPYSYLLGVPRGLAPDIFQVEALESIVGKPDQEHQFKEYMKALPGSRQCYIEDWKGVKEDVTVDTWEDYERVRKLVDGH